MQEAHDIVTTPFSGGGGGGGGPPALGAAPQTPLGVLAPNPAGGQPPCQTPLLSSLGAKPQWGLGAGAPSGAWGRSPQGNIISCLNTSLSLTKMYGLCTYNWWMGIESCARKLTITHLMDNPLK